MAFFHAAVRDGGLGLPVLTTLIPSLVSVRFSKLEKSSYPAAKEAFASRGIQRKILSRGLPRQGNSSAYDPKLRHDAVVRALSEALTAKGWAVIAEPRIQTHEGLRRPDIIAGRGQEVALVDAQVVFGAKSLSISHREKSAKYASNPDVQEYAMSTTDPRPTRLTFTSCTLSWRGVWSAESYQDLCSLGVPARVLEGITTRVLQGSHTNWGRFNAMTLNAPRRSAHRVPSPAPPRTSVG
ncbi:hypothetical protein CBL_12086 [Carabus blaptoides fortunei]